jgi:hypothetical protein
MTTTMKMKAITMGTLYEPIIIAAAGARCRDASI